MEDLLAREQSADRLVHRLLEDKEAPIENLLAAFDEYRAACQCIILADYENGVAMWETKLWQMHGEGRKFFHAHLSSQRKQETPVGVRAITRCYLMFLKAGERFYRQYIHQLSAAFGGIEELQVVAHQVKAAHPGESSQGPVSPELRRKILESCHETLVYLGDLSRYRASEGLDKKRDYGPAVGYYSLACTLRPSSGTGHHQQAVIALDERQHLRAIYHLYRAIVVDEPNPNAPNNLRKEFERVTSAWDRGELIEKRSVSNPDAAKNALVGWYVHLHSICYKGEPFKGYDELEREVLGRLTVQIKDRGDMSGVLNRVVITNISAQYIAMEKFQEKQIQQHQNAFLHFFRFNVKTFTTLLRVLYDEFKAVDLSVNSDEDDATRLAARLSLTTRRLLSSVRVYSSWLVPITHLLEGLATDDVLQGAIEEFWPIYAKVLDLVAAIFPIWDLEDLTEITYLLEEDADTLGFKPLGDDKNRKVWYNVKTGVQKLHWSDVRVQRVSADEEMLMRVKEFLVTGLNLANDDDSAPIKLQATRILHRDAQDVEPLPMPVFPKKVIATLPKLSGADKAVKPLSYAAAATNGKTKTLPPVATTNGSTGSMSSNSQRDAQMIRMVNDLVDDNDESNIPVTPPRHDPQWGEHVLVHANGFDNFPTGTVRYYGQKGLDLPSNFAFQHEEPTSNAVVLAAPTIHTPTEHGSPVNNTAVDRLQSVSSLWNDAESTNFSSGLPTGTLASPAQLYSRGHSRVNSASSIRSRTSQGPGNTSGGIGDSWSSLESAAGRPALPNGGRGFNGSALGSPLLFGAGASVWSTSAKPPFGRSSPGNGKEG